MRAAALPPGRNRQESRHGKAPPVHLLERGTRRPNRRSPALNRPRPKWKPSCESRLSTTGRGKLPRSAESSTASRSRNDGGRRKNRDYAWSAAYRPLTPLLNVRRKAQGISKEVGGPAEKQEELRKEPPNKGTRPTGRPRPSDNTPDPSRGPVGVSIAPTSNTWAFRQVGVLNSVAKGRRTATMALGRVSMAGPFVRSGVRPAYPVFMLFLTFA